MAMSKCGSCGATGRWQLSEVSPSGSRYKYYFVQCAGCGTVINTVEYNNVVATLGEMEKKFDERLKKIEQQNAYTMSYLERIVRSIK